VSGHKQRTLTRRTSNKPPTLRQLQRELPELLRTVVTILAIHLDSTTGSSRRVVGQE
jgi:hypothetical protein